MKGNEPIASKINLKIKTALDEAVTLLNNALIESKIDLSEYEKSIKERM